MRTFNISEIINTQVPDAEGNIIPADIHEGSAKLVGEKADNQLILAAMDAGTYNVKKATCGYYCQGCDGWVDSWVDPASFSVDVNGQTQVDFIDEWNTGEEFDLTGESNWSSGTPSTVSVDNGLITGLAAGSASVEASDPYEPGYVENACLPSGWYCPLWEGTGYGASGDVTGPDHVEVVVDQEGYPAACPATGIYLRQMQMQVLDSNNNAITTDASIQESYSGLTTNTCGNGQPIPASCAPTGNVGGVGQFLDSMAVSGSKNDFCDTGIKQSSGCGYSLTSIWNACGNSGSNTLWTSPRITLSNEVEVNGSTSTFSPGTQFH